MACDKCGEITIKDLENEQIIKKLKDKISDLEQIISLQQELEDK